MTKRHRIVRLALRAFPRHFRARYAREMLDAYAARLEEIARTRGRLPAALFALAAGRELVVSGLRERFAPRPRVAPPNRQEVTRMHAVLTDCRYAMRVLVRRPALSLVVIVTLGIAIGASTTMFSIANGVVLQPLPYPAPSELVRVYDTFAERGDLSNASSPANFADWRGSVRAFGSMAAYTNGTLTYTGAELALPLAATSVSFDWTDVLRTPPALGRGFTKDEETFGNHRVLILSHGLWEGLFGGEPDVIGRRVSMEGGDPYTVVGVMPAGFAFPTPETELWTPLAFNFDVAGSRGVHYLTVIARLASGATFESAHREMNLVMDRLRQAHPEPLRGWGTRVVSLHESMVGDVRPRVMIFLGAVGLLLLVACVNVANLSLAHAVARFRELALRAAMGAGRWRLTRQMAIEGIMLALVAATLGTAIAVFTVRLVVTMAPDSIPRLYDVGIDGDVIAFTTALSLVIGILIGVIPALRAGRRDLFDTLREGTRADTGRAGHFVRSGFVVAQVALAVVITVGSGLLVKSFARLSMVDAGVHTDGVLVATVSVPASRYPEATARSRFLLDYVERLRQTPGVTAAAAASQLPLEGFGIAFAYSVTGSEIPPSERPNGDFRVVSPGYFETMGIPLRRGRTFDERDRPDSAPVVVIDQALARATFGADDPVGRFITIAYGRDQVPRQVVGVVSDVRQRTLDAPVQPGYYLPLTQVSWNMLRIVVRTDLPPLSLADAMRRQLAAMDPLIPARDLAALDDLAARSVVVPRFNTILLAVFAAIALLVATSGVYSVMSYAVTQRTREIGVRMALGACAGQVRRSVWRRGLLLGLAGGTIGVSLAFILTPQVATLLYEVDVHDLQSFAVPPLLFLVVAWLASYVPARRASRLDPVEALRAD